MQIYYKKTVYFEKKIVSFSLFFAHVQLVCGPLILLYLDGGIQILKSHGLQRSINGSGEDNWVLSDRQTLDYESTTT